MEGFFSKMERKYFEGAFGILWMLGMIFIWAYNTQVKTSNEISSRKVFVFMILHSSFGGLWRLQMILYNEMSFYYHAIVSVPTEWQMAC